MATKFTSVKEYHAVFPAGTRKLLKQLSEAIEQAAPAATPCIAYNMPCFKANKNLVYYAAYKNHIGLYPGSAAIVLFKKDIEAYKTSKGAIQFPLVTPIAVDLKTKIVKYRVAEDTRIAGAGKKTSKK